MGLDANFFLPQTIEIFVNGKLLVCSQRSDDSQLAINIISKEWCAY